MKVYPWLWRAVVILFLTAVVSNAATVQGQLVYSSGGRPAPYVGVRLNSASRGPSEFAYSGNDGRFYLRNVPPGAYQLEIWRAGRMVTSVRVNVQEPRAELGALRMP